MTTQNDLPEPWKLKQLRDVLRKLQVESLSEVMPRVDTTGLPTHTSGMSDQISRNELDAKLEAIEARMDARLSSVTGKIDAFLAAQAERDLRLQEKMSVSITLSDEWNQKFRLLAEQAVDSARRADDSAQQAATLKNHFWASVAAQILAVAAILVGAYFANQASVIGIASGTLSAYQAGKADASAQQKQATPTEQTQPSQQPAQ